MTYTFSCMNHFAMYYYYYIFFFIFKKKTKDDAPHLLYFSNNCPKTQKTQQTEMTGENINIVIPYRLQWELDDTLPLWKDLEENHNINFIRYKITTAQDFQNWLPTSKCHGIWMTEEFCSILGGPSPFLKFLPDTIRVMLVPWVGVDYVLNHNEIKWLREEKNCLVVNVGPNAADSVCELAIHLVTSVFRMTSFWEFLIKFVEFGKISNCRDYLGTDLNNIEDLQFICKNGDVKTINYYQFPQKLKMEEDCSKVANVVQNFKVGGKHIISPMRKTVLILGFGSIGRTIGYRLNRAFDMKIQYYKRSGPISQDQLGYKAEYMSDLNDPRTWSEADLIMLSLPGGISTDDMINDKTLAMCKGGVRLVNVGRGNSVDEDALLRALENGKVASCGLDVFKNEGSGQINKKLLQRWDVTALPHMGSAVTDMMSLQTLVTLQNIENIFVNNGNGVYPVE
ncbi:putative 2-hydroxyacid dehydrogenase YPL113C [Monosporozyma unispora]